MADTFHSVSNDRGPLFERGSLQNKLCEAFRYPVRYFEKIRFATARLDRFDMLSNHLSELTMQTFFRRLGFWLFQSR